MLQKHMPLIIGMCLVVYFIPEQRVRQRAGVELDGLLASGIPIVGFTERAAISAVKGGDNIALGVTEHLDDFARGVNGSTWKTWGAQDFPSQFMSTIGNPSNIIHFNMTGPNGSMINAWKAITEGSKGLGASRATSWELFQLYSNPEALQRTIFYYNGKVIPNPF